MPSLFFLISVWLLVVLGWGLFFRFLIHARNSSGLLTPIAGWVIGLVYFVLTPLTTMLALGGYDIPAQYPLSVSWMRIDFARDRFRAAALLILISIVVVLLLASITSIRRNKAHRVKYVKPSRQKLERLLALLGALWATKWLTVIVAFGWQGLVLLRWFERSELLREKLGEAANYLLKAWQSVLFCFVGVSVAYMFFATPSSWKRTTASMFLIFAVMITELILSGNRMYIALLFVASATALILTNRRKALLVLTCLLPFAAFVSLFWAAWRQDASSVHAAVAVALQSFSHGHWISTTVMELTEGFSVALLLHLIADIGNKFPLLFGSSILRIFLAPIPRTFMPDKPDTFSIVLANYYAPHSAGLSLGATAVGEAFANLGLFGIALIGTYTVILMWLSNKLLIYASPPRIITSAIGFGLAFWLARQNFFDIVLLSIYATVILVFLKPDRKELTQKISPSSDAR